MKEVIAQLKLKQNLSQEEIQDVMDEIMSGQASEQDIRDYLIALNEKGPTIEEITGAANIMRKFVVGIKVNHPVVLDTCGTGGDLKGTFNISTITAFVVAGAGVVVAKHGNRSVSSRCGSADVLEAVGVNLDAEEDNLKQCLNEVGIAFLFAQRHHPAMKYVASVRKDLGVKTIFNILGPLTNPAQATHQIMGVYSRDLVEPMAHVLKNLGLKRALVVHGNDGLDEITTTDKTFVSQYNGKEVISYDINPIEFGIDRVDEKELQGGDLNDNVRILDEVLSGKRGPKRDIVVINAAYALYLSEKTSSLAEAIDLARHVIDSGKAFKKLEKLKEFTCRG